MTKKEIIMAFDGTQPSHKKVTDVKVSRNHLVDSIELDRTTMELYYKINIDSMLGLSEEDIDDMKEEGWSLSEDKSTLILFITN